MQKSLLNVFSRRLAITIIVMILLSAPLFYFIVVHYYAEDLLRVARLAGVPEGHLDLEWDTLIGLLMQVGLVMLILAIALLGAMRFIPKRLLRPFEDTLSKIKGFRVEKGNVPTFAKTDIKEFAQLNRTLTDLMTASSKSYQVQKEFTENASHELQTPLAVAMSKLDLLIQDPNLTESQAVLAQDIYYEMKRMSALSRSLLLLAKLSNRQFDSGRDINLNKEVETLMPSLLALAGDLDIRLQMDENITIKGNGVLLESLISNLFVNAVRHNRHGGYISIRTAENSLIVSNTSDETALDSTHIFERFHQSTDRRDGHGLGLAIVKAICDYHGWTVNYSYSEGIHTFRVEFGGKE